jgi:hypothetical protein
LPLLILPPPINRRELDCQATELLIASSAARRG